MGRGDRQGVGPSMLRAPAPRELAGISDNLLLRDSALADCAEMTSLKSDLLGSRGDLGTLLDSLRKLGGSGALAQGLERWESFVSEAKSQLYQLEAIEEGLSGDTIDRSLALMRYAKALSEFAELREASARALAELQETLETYGTHESREQLQQIVTTIEDRFESLLDGHLSLAREEAQQHEMSFESDAELLRWRSWSSALDGLDASRSANTANAWAYLSRVLGSEDIEEMRRSPEAYSRHSIATAIALGVQAIDDDPDLRFVAEQLTGEEEDLCLRARLLGRIPETELVYMPSREWAVALRRQDTPAWGEHFSRDSHRPSFTYLDTIRDDSSPESILRLSRQASVHELIHAGQPVGEPSEDPSLDRALEEGITETLTQIRSDEVFARAATEENLSSEHSYTNFVRATISLMDRADIPMSDRELFLENMNSLPPRERLAMITRICGEPGEDVWHAALS